MIDKPIKIQKAYMILTLLDEYYKFEPSGGSLHVITEDKNYGKGYAKFCLDYSIKNKDFWGEQISKLLLEFDEEDQEQLFERSWEIYEHFV